MYPVGLVPPMDAFYFKRKGCIVQLCQHLSLFQMRWVHLTTPQKQNLIMFTSETCLPVSRFKNHRKLKPKHVLSCCAIFLEKKIFLLLKQQQHIVLNLEAFYKQWTEAEVGINLPEVLLSILHFKFEWMAINPFLSNYLGVLASRGRLSSQYWEILSTSMQWELNKCWNEGK